MSGDIVTTVLMQPVTGVFTHSKRMYGKVDRDERRRVATDGFDPLDTIGDDQRPSLIRYGVAVATLSTPTSVYGSPLLDEKTGRAPFLHTLTQSGIATATSPERRKGKVLEIGTILFRRGEETNSLQDVIGNIGLMAWSDSEDMLAYLHSRNVYQNWNYADLSDREQGQTPQEVTMHDLGYHWHDKDGETPLTLLPLAVVLGLLHNTPNSRRERAKRLTALANATDEYNHLGKEVPLAERLAALTDPLNQSEGLRILAQRTTFRDRQQVHVDRPFVIEGHCNIYDSAEAHRGFEASVEGIAVSLAERLSPTPKKPEPGPFVPPKRDDRGGKGVWSAGFTP